MSLTYGFYNSINGDRKYNAAQLSSIFDGVILDGVFMSIGKALVSTAISGMTISVGEGRAWFNHTWTNLDASLLLTVEQSDLILNRIDTIVLEINSGDDVRANTIKIIKGTPATNPVAPTLTLSEYVHQYPLCNIYVGANVTKITQANITNRVGTSDCPFVTGILETINVDSLLTQWDAEFHTMLTSRDNTYAAMINGKETDFDTWFETIKNHLAGDIAGSLQLQINGIKDDFNAHASDNKIHIHYGGITTNVGNDYVLGIPVITSLSEGDIICFVINATSSGPTTLNWSGTGSKQLKNIDGSNVTNLLKDGMYTFRYNGTDLVMQGGTGTGGGADVYAREQIILMEKKLHEQGLIDFVNQSGLGFYDTFETDEYIDKNNTTTVFDSLNKSVRFSNKDLPTVASSGNYSNTNIINVDQPMYVGDVVNGIAVSAVSNSSISTNKTMNGSIVTPSVPTTSIGALPQYLDNGWIVESELRSGVGIYFRVSKDYGTTWSELCFLNSINAARFSVTSKGSMMYLVVEAVHDLWFYSFNALTVSDADISNSSNAIRIDYSQTFGDGVHLIITSTNRLIVAYTSLNAISTSLGIKTAYSDDLGVTWPTPVQMINNTVSTDAYYWPWLVEKSNGLISLICTVTRSSPAGKYLRDHHLKSDLSGYDIAPNVYSNVTTTTGYDQIRPMCIRIKNGTYAGRLVVVWYGYISTTIEHVRLSYSDDNGNTWQGALDLTSSYTSTVNIQPVITQDISGKIYVLWNYDNAGIFYITTTDCVTYSAIANRKVAGSTPCAPLVIPIVFTGNFPPFIYSELTSSTIKMYCDLTFTANTSQITLASNITVTLGQSLTLTRVLKLSMKTQEFNDTFNTLDLAVYPKSINKSTVKGNVNNSTSVVTNSTTRTLSIGDKLFMNGVLNSIVSLTSNTIPISKSTDVVTATDIIFKSAKPQYLDNGWIVTASYTATPSVVFKVSKDNGATWSILTTWVITRRSTGSNYSSLAICSKGTKIYAVLPSSTEGYKVSFTKFDAVTVGSTISTLNTILVASGNFFPLHAIQIGINQFGVLNIIATTWYSTGTIANIKSLDDGTSWVTQAGVAGYESICNGTGMDMSFCYNKLGNPVCLSPYGANVQVSYWDSSAWVRNTSIYSNGSINLESSTTNPSYSGFNMILQKYGVHSGRIWFAFQALDSTDNVAINIRVLYSDDNGITWTHYKVTNGNIYNQQHPSLSEDVNGNISIVWNGYTSAHPTKSNLRQIIFNGNAWSDIIELTSQEADNIILPVVCSNYHDYNIPLLIYRDSYKVGFMGNYNIVGGYNLTMQNPVTLTDGKEIYVQDFTAKIGDTNLVLDSIDEEKHIFKGKYLSTKEVDLEMVSTQETYIDAISYAIA